MDAKVLSGGGDEGRRGGTTDALRQGAGVGSVLRLIASGVVGTGPPGGGGGYGSVGGIGMWRPLRER